MNTFNAIGNTTKDAELRYTPSGKAVANFGLAINKKYGEKETTLFLNCVVWGKLAELQIAKGTRIGITGELEPKEWTDREGKKHSSIEVRVEKIDFLSAKKESSESGNPQVSQDDEDIQIPGEEEMF